MPGFYNDVLTVQGAYGREPTMADWRAGKDFKIVAGPYFSIRDVDQILDYGTEQIVFMNSRGFVEFIVEIA